MATGSSSSAADKYVVIRCEAWDDKFKVRSSLLLKKAPHFQTYIDEEDGSFIDLEVSYIGFCHFVRWLDTGSLLELSKMDNLPVAHWIDQYDDCEEYWKFGELLAAYETGAELQCVDFMDTVMDGLITYLEAGQIPLEEILCAVFVEHPADFGPRQLVVDFLIYGEPSSRIDMRNMRCNYETLDNFTSELSKALAKEILTANNVEAPAFIESEEVCKLLVSGFQDLRQTESFFRTGDRPWVVNPCKYHQHTVRQMPCYSTKQQKASRAKVVKLKIR